MKKKYEVKQTITWEITAHNKEDAIDKCQASWAEMKSFEWQAKQISTKIK